MKKIISSCGLDCSTCDAWKATINDDDNLRRETVEKWKVMYNAAGLTYQMINCTGCREAGLKFVHCAECNIRKCAVGKNFITCAECGEMTTCELVGFIHKHVPEALNNLLSLSTN